jgi:hypothetical protein
LSFPLLSALLFLPMIVEPPLELALRRCAQTLKLNDGVEEICSCSGQVCNLPRQLLG